MRRPGAAAARRDLLVRRWRLNAHVVIEEYVAPERVAVAAASAERPAIIVLSARNEERLRERVAQLLGAIESGSIGEADLADVAYTLQVGREAMEARLGVIAASMAELRQKLQAFVAAEPGIEDLYRGQLKREKDALALFADEDIAKTIAGWAAKGKYGKLLELWVKGLWFDWSTLYGEVKPRRISLPTYPFAKERYWVPEPVAAEAGIAGAAKPGRELLHPLIHRNSSDLSGLRFTTAFTGEEFVLVRDAQGKRSLSDVAHLEMARAAVSAAAGTREGSAIRLKHVLWTLPLPVEPYPCEVHVRLSPEKSGEIAFEIYRDVGSASVTYSKGVAVIEPVREAPSLDITALRARCTESVSSETLNERFVAKGAGDHSIVSLDVGLGETVGRLSLPTCLSDNNGAFVLHPSQLAGALQTSLVVLRPAHAGRTIVPAELQELQVFRACTASMWAVARQVDACAVDNSDYSVDIDLCDDDGFVCVQLRGLKLRPTEEPVARSGVSSPITVDFLRARPDESHPTPSSLGSDIDRESLQHVVRTMLIDAVSATLKLGPQDIDPDAELPEVGLDSIMMMELGIRINRLFGVTLSSGKFFEISTLNGLIKHLSHNHTDTVAEKLLARVPASMGVKELAKRSEL